MSNLGEEILRYVSRGGYDPLRPKQLAKKLGLSRQIFDRFEDELQHLVEQGRLKISESGRVRPGPPKQALAGVMDRTSNGSGYVTLKNPEAVGVTGDVFIALHDTMEAQSGDEVLIVLLNRRRSSGQRIGRVVDIVAQASRQFVGSYFEQEGQGFVKVVGTQFRTPIWVGDAGAKGVFPEDKVVIEIMHMPTKHQYGEGVITKVLGARGTPEVETMGVIHEFDIPHEFPKDVLQNATEIAAAVGDEIPADRTDLTETLIVTIDPKSARDFDDAISLSRNEKGTWDLGVHIADVAAFVTPGTLLDDEAKKRGTSVYLPQMVIPMLPEVISNGLASLQQDRVRYTKTVFIEYDDQGRRLNTRLANSVIKVARRFTYEEVMAFLEKDESAPQDIPQPIAKLLADMHYLAMTLRKRRFERGALELSMPETVLEFDQEGKVSGATKAVNDESHQMIEEFMLAANIAVAEKLTDLNVPFLRRIHPNPAPVKLVAFRNLAADLGYQLPEEPSKEDIQKLLNETVNTPHGMAIHFMFLRSLKQATYSPEETGHFALAETNYGHFTSPIRRYPDLTIHRLVDEYVKTGEIKHAMAMESLVNLGVHCSTTERRAEKAERLLTKLKLLDYMSSRVGEQFEAVITGVERFGLFCQCVDVPAEGLVSLRDLEALDLFDHDRDTHQLIGRRGKFNFRLGDLIKVQVGKVDPDRRELDFFFVEHLRSIGGSSTGKKSSRRKSGSDESHSRKGAGKSKRSKPSAGAKTRMAFARKKPKGGKKRKK